MKKIFKTHSKKGFTLLEVMLAVAVMAIGSTMIMQGFIATMNCSRNSKIYSRVGSTHYAELITKVATYAQQSAATRTYSGGTESIAEFGTGYSAGIYVWKLDGTGESGINVGAATGNAREADLSASALDNRSAFFYLPSGPGGATSCGRGHVGEFAYCRFVGGDSEWATPALRCIHQMDEYSTPGNPNYHQENHRYCFQYD